MPSHLHPLLSASIALVALAPAPAWAHAFAQRYDLPLPLAYVLLAAGAAVALSFVAATMAGSTLAPSVAAREPHPAGPRLTWLRRWAIEPIAVALFVLLIAAGLLGPETPHLNVLPVALWILWWVGFTILVALIGDVWRIIDPLRILARWAAAIAERAGLRPARPPLLLSPAIGVWPAVVLFFAFAWAELIWSAGIVPNRLAVAILAYSVLTWTAMVLFGIDTWCARGEAFARFFRLVGSIAPLDIAGRRRNNYPARMTAEPAADRSQVAFVVLVLSTVAFDGIRETGVWSDLQETAMILFERMGIVAALGQKRSQMIFATAGLLTLPALLWTGYTVTCRAMSIVTTRLSPGTPSIPSSTVAQAFAGSLVPIAVGYHIAHYATYLLIQGQWIIASISDPFGLGWNLLGTRTYKPNIDTIDAGTVWWLTVISIVTGHVAAVAMAHRIALCMYPSRSISVASQYPMLVLMVGYTMLSLWILAQPIIAH